MDVRVSYTGSLGNLRHSRGLRSSASSRRPAADLPRSRRVSNGRWNVLLITLTIYTVNLPFVSPRISPISFFNLIIFFFVAWIVLSRIVVINEDLFFFFGISYFKIVSDLF